MSKVKGHAELTDTQTRVVFDGLDPNAYVNMNINYIDERGDPSFSINAYSTTDEHGHFEATLDVGKTMVQSFTQKDIDRIECDGETTATFHVESPSD